MITQLSEKEMYVVNGGRSYFYKLIECTAYYLASKGSESVLKKLDIPKNWELPINFVTFIFAKSVGYLMEHVLTKSTHQHTP